jgi:hypothetical protein
MTSHDTNFKALYDRLVASRGKVANEVRLYPEQLTTNCTLRHIAATRTSEVGECLKLREQFPQLRKLLAKEYVKVVKLFQEERQEVCSITP